MYRVQSQQGDEHKGAPVQVGEQNANPLKQILDTLLIMGDGKSEEWDLLQYLAWLDPEFISEELLLAVTKNDQATLRKTIEKLEKLGLVEALSKGGIEGLSMAHQTQEHVVNYAIQTPAESKAPAQLVVSLLELLSDLVPEVTNQNNEDWEIVKVYVSTVEALMDHSARRGLAIPENKDLALLNAKLGAFYWKVSIDPQKTLDYKARALAIYKSIHQGNHPDIAISLNNLGMTCAALGLTNKALPYLEQALVMKRALYVGPHPDMATALNNLGNAYVTLGESWKGIAYIQQALMMNQVLYQGNHPTVANALNNVGSAYATVVDTQLGLDYQKQALAMYEALYEAPHPDIAMTLHNMGLAYEKLGDAQQALSCKERALEMRQALYEGFHPDVARSFHAVGDTYKALGEADRALSYYKAAYAIRCSIYGDNAPDVASSLNAIGMAHEALGDNKKCLTYQQRALKIWQTLFKGNHPGIATTFSNMGIAYRKLGDAQKSLDYRQQALTMREALYSGNHPEVANSLNAVGVAYVMLGDAEKGLGYYERALVMREALYPGDNPDVANSLNNIGIAYQKLGDVNKALGYYKRALMMREALYPANHNDIVTSLNAVGVAHKKLGNIKTSLEYRERALMMRLVLEGNKPDIANSLNNLGIEYQKLGDMDKALDYYKRALVIREALYPGNHPDVAESLNAIGVAYNSAGNVDEAQNYFERADNMRYELFEHADKMRQALGEFKGQGTLDYGVDSSLEYYNSGIDQILGLRLSSIGYHGKAIVLKSWYCERGFNTNVDAILSGNNAKTVLAPINLYNKHWLGLAFKKVGAIVEVTYMDSEQRKVAPELKEGLITSDYKSRFLDARLEKQRYSNCGLEVIENFVYYLTGTRATQEGAVWLHSLLVENSLLDPKEYVLKIEENNKLIGFLSNTAPLPIRSIGISTFHHRPEERSLEINLLPAVKQFNNLWTKWVQDKWNKITVVVYKTTLGFKGLDLAVDSARLVYEPSLDNTKTVALDVANLYSMYSGVNGYSTLVSGAEVAYQMYLGEYRSAFNTGAAALSSMALPYILALGNRPYLGFAYGVWVSASTTYNAALNVYSFALELSEDDASLKSTVAYKGLMEWLTASPLHALYDFGAKAKEYKLQVNDLLFEKEKSIIQAKVKDEFGQKVFDYIYLPELLGKYALLNGVIRGDLTEEETQSLKFKPIAISYGALEYDRCVMAEDSPRLEEGVEHYYCCNIAEQIIDHVALTTSGGLEILENL